MHSTGTDDKLDYTASNELGEVEHWTITSMDMLSFANQVTLAMVDTTV